MREWHSYECLFHSPLHAMANKIIRKNIDHHKIDHRMHLYELTRAGVFAALACEFQATTWNGYLSALHRLP